MKSLAVGFIRRLFVAAVAVILIGGFGIVYGHFFGSSKIAGSASIMLIAWTWALPQIFVVVCVVWFIFQQIRRKGRSPAL